MDIRYKIDVVKALKQAGYTTYKLRNEKLLSERTLTLLRQHKPVSLEVVARLCELLSCDVGDLLTVNPEEGYPQGEMGIAPEPPLDSQNTR